MPLRHFALLVPALLSVLPALAAPALAGPARVGENGRDREAPADVAQPSVASPPAATTAAAHREQGPPAHRPLEQEAAEQAAVAQPPDRQLPQQQVPTDEAPADQAPAAPAASERPSPADSSAAKGPGGDDETPRPTDRFTRWLREVDPLITAVERAAFLGLVRDHHRDAFIRSFWQVRDPYPETGRNELKENWDERVFTAQSEFESLEDDRARILLVHGPPDATMDVRCTTTRVPVSVWLYESSDVVQFRFLLVFVRPMGIGRASIWRPGMGPLENVIATARSCINGARLDGLLDDLRGLGSQYDLILNRVLAKPKPRSEEWLATFQAFTAEVPEGTPRFDAEVAYEFLGRVQSRTVLQSVIQVPRSAATVEEFAGFRSYNFELTGEVVLGNELFETFRYKFGFPAEGGGAPIPMAFQRYLRPGDYTIILKLVDLASKAVFLHEQPVRVPRMEELAAVPSDLDNETMRLFQEAAEAVGGDEAAIRLVPPPGDLHSGFVRFDTLLSGSDIARVVFYLDSKEAVTKNKPPFNVEIDLGPYPRARTLRAEALDAAGNVVADDEVVLNAGEHRFAVRLLEPRDGRRYQESLVAKAEVDIPADRALERVEFFLDERRVATVFQKPFVQPIRLPTAGAVSYVRAVAYLADGNSTEDVVFVNAPDTTERMDIQFVELYAAALDGEGRLIDGLGRDDFHVIEDGVEQEIVRFDRVENLPFHAVILLDNSASMGGALDEARRAALRFFQLALTPRDRAAVITFNRFPNLAVKFTSDSTLLGGGLQGLTAEGQTALYDSLMFALYYFSGIKGQRAVLLLSDGKDEVSRFDYEETLEYARRAGVTIYSIGLAIDDGQAKNKLINLANETGGRSYFISNSDGIAAVYDLVQQDLRSQYLLAYQSSNTSGDDDFRQVEVKVQRPRATVRTLAGYYP
jgi:Ca-activated chloride channel family protein